jgi:hypothetical protein
MKIGDLVRMEDSDFVIGLVIDLGPVPHRPNTCNRVGVLWTDGNGIDYEPKAWLEVIDESR